MTWQHNKGEEKAASPVIGVILMVATTVIVAAIIGSFVLNSASGAKGAPQAGVTFDVEAGESIELKISEANNVDKIVLIPPNGKRFEETPENDATYGVCCYYGGWTNETARGEWKMEEGGKKMVNNDPRPGDRLLMSPATNTFQGGDNLSPGDALTVVGISDGDRAVLTEHVVTEKISTDR